MSQLHLYDLLVAQPDLVPQLSAGRDELLLLSEKYPEVQELCLSCMSQQAGLNLKKRA